MLTTEYVPEARRYPVSSLIMIFSTSNFFGTLDVYRWEF